MGELRDSLDANKAEENRRRKMLQDRTRQSHEYALEVVGILREERVSVCGLYQVSTHSKSLPGTQGFTFTRGVSRGGPTNSVTYSARRLGSGWPLEQTTMDIDTNLFVLEDGSTYQTAPLYGEYGHLVNERPYRVTKMTAPEETPFYFYGELDKGRITDIVAELISNKGAHF